MSERTRLTAKLVRNLGYIAIVVWILAMTIIVFIVGDRLDQDLDIIQGIIARAFFYIPAIFIFYITSAIAKIIHPEISK